MQIITIIYIILYLIYVIFGDHIIAKFIFKEKIDFPPIISQVIKRSVFITYLSLLAAAYVFSYFSTTNWLIAFILAFTSLLSFSIKWRKRGFSFPPNGNYYFTGIIQHFLIIIPLLFLIPRLNIRNINVNKLIIFSLILFVYAIYHKPLYVY